MNLSNLRVTEIVALGTAISGIGLATMKFYHLFNKMIETLEDLNETINNITIQNANHESRITILEQKVISIFKNLAKLEEKR